MSDWSPPQSDLADDTASGEGINAPPYRVSQATQAARDRAGALLRATYDTNPDYEDASLAKVEPAVAKTAGGKPLATKMAAWAPPSQDLQPAAFKPPEADAEQTQPTFADQMLAPWKGETISSLAGQNMLFRLNDYAVKLGQLQVEINKEQPDLGPLELAAAARQQYKEKYGTAPELSINWSELPGQLMDQIVKTPALFVSNLIKGLIVDPELLAVGTTGLPAKIASTAGRAAVRAGEVGAQMGAQGAAISAAEQLQKTGEIQLQPALQAGAQTAAMGLVLGGLHSAVDTGLKSVAEGKEVPPAAEKEFAKRFDDKVTTGTPADQAMAQTMREAGMSPEEAQRMGAAVAPLNKAIDDALRYMEPEGEPHAIGQGQEQARDLVEHQGTGIDRTATEAGDRNLAESRGEIPPQPEGIEPGTVAERRQDLERRAAVADMTPDEMRQALLTDPLTGLPNRRAYVEAEKKPIQSSIDVDGLKWANDNLGHEAGDQIIKAVGQALSHVEGYHISGDEFIAQFKDRAAADAGMDQFHKNLANVELEFKTPDGEIVGMKLGASHGIGESLSEADTALQQNKLSRQEAGLRSARGDEPPGLSRQPANLPSAEGAVAPTGERVPSGGNEVTNQINLADIKPEIGWAETGGHIIRDPTTGDVVGRTKWIPKSDFWGDKPSAISEREAHAAVDKVEAGKKLTPREQRFVDYARSELQKRADESAAIEHEAREERLGIQQFGKVDPKLLAAVGLAGVGAAYGFWLNKDPKEAIRDALITGGIGAAALTLGKIRATAKRVLDTTADTRYRVDHLTNDYLGRIGLSKLATLKVAEAVKAMVPDRARREAMTHAIQAGDLSTLSPIERAASIEVKRFFDEIGARAQKAGIGLDNLLEDYVTQLWVKGVNTKESLLKNLQGIMAETRPSGAGMSTKTRFGMERTIPNYKAGMEAGMLPVTLDIADIMRTYGDSINKTIQNKNLIEGLRRDTMTTGAPTLVRAEDLDKFVQRQRDSAAGRELADVSPRASDLETQLSRIDAPRDYVTIDHPQMMGYRVHQDVAAPLKALFEAGNPIALERAAYAVSIAAKRALFSFSLFHTKSLMDALMGAGIKAAMNVPKALNDLRVGDRATKVLGKTAGDLVKDLVYGGLQVTKAPLESDANAFRNALKLIEAKAPFPISTPVKGVRWTQEHMDRFLWENVHPALKTATALATYEKALIDPTFWQKMRSKTGFAPDWRNVPKEQIARDVASYTNDLFGGLDWFRIADAVQNKYGRDLALGLASKRGKMLMQVMMLAPDWTVATARSMFKAIPGMSTPQLGALHRAYLLRQGLLYLTLYNGINQAFSGHNIWENKDKTMVDLGDGRKMQMAKHTMEPVHWLTQPFKQAGNKLGYVPSELYNQIAGSEYIGGRPMDTSVTGRLAHAAKRALPIPSTVAAQSGPGPAISGFFGAPIYGRTEQQARDDAVEKALGVYKQKVEAGVKQRYGSEAAATRAAETRVHRQYEKQRQEQSAR